VDELAGLRVTPGIVDVGLRRRDGCEATERRPRPEQRGLPACGQDVAAEQSREHRDASVEDPTGAVGRAQEPSLELVVTQVEQVVGGSLEGTPQALRAFDRRTTGSPGCALPVARVVERVGCMPRPGLARGEPKARVPLRPSIEPDGEAKPIRVQLQGRRCVDDVDPEPAFHPAPIPFDRVVEPQGLGVRIQVPLGRAVLLGLAPDLRDVGEVGIDLDVDGRLARHCRVVPDDEGLEHARSDPTTDLYLERVLGQVRTLRPPTRPRDAHHRLPSVVLGPGLGDEVGSGIADRQSIARENACVAMEQPVPPSADGAVGRRGQHRVPGEDRRAVSERHRS
jgi:hypothetical protein